MTTQLPNGTGSPARVPSRDPGVLVVDDDDQVRSMVCAALARAGFRVWDAADGVRAVELYRENPGEIDVVLLDVRMPGLDGPQTLEALRRLDPDVVACFMSGDTAEHEPHDLLRLGARHFFPKPFPLGEVTEAVRALVGTDQAMPIAVAAG